MSPFMSNVSVLHTPGFDSPKALIEAIARGQMVVLVDNEDRENEGDLVMAAEYVEPEHINFMTQFARGLVCLTITPEKAEQLQLTKMVAHNTNPYETNFTVSIEAAEGVTTGISAFDRAHTIQTAAKADAKPDDLVRPGHVFPIVAQAGGVLSRPGHTEASVDLARLAELQPAGVIVEIMSADGSMARRDELMKFAHKHNLKIGTIADLIQYRKVLERYREAEISQKVRQLKPENAIS
jgi:3,4-dihydroxy 2-butanone 4-phosphate synthase/GTP cyclohydrolase II